MKRLLYLSLVGLVVLLSLSATVSAGEINGCGEFGPVNIDNSMVVEGNCQCTLTGTTVNGDLTVKNGGRLLCAGASIHGDISVEKASWIRLTGQTVVDGSVQVNGVTGPESSSILDTRISGDLVLQKNDASVEVRNSLIDGGDLELTMNNGGLTITHNEINGDLVCKKNDPAPRGTGNIMVRSSDRAVTWLRPLSPCRM